MTGPAAPSSSPHGAGRGEPIGPSSISRPGASASPAGAEPARTGGPALSPATAAADPAAVQAHLRRAGNAVTAPWLHGEVARRMAERLEVVRLQPTVVLDWWSALGGGLPALRARYPRARIEAIEPTEALAARSAAALQAPWWTARRWQQGPPAPVWREEAMPPEAHAQLLWSNMMLHWSAEPRRVFAQWQRLIGTEGFVMFSCFGPDTVCELHRIHRQLGEAPPGHAFIDMHDLGDALLASGFADPVMDMERLTLTWPDLPRALLELRGMGGNASVLRGQGLRTPRRHRRLLDAIGASLAGEDGRIAMSFEIVYGHAFKPQPKFQVAPQTRVPVDALRAMARNRGKGP